MQVNVGLGSAASVGVRKREGKRARISSDSGACVSLQGHDARDRVHKPDETFRVLVLRDFT